MSVEEEKICRECDGKEFYLDNGKGEHVCNRCGLVYDNLVIDYGPDWRSFEGDSAAESGDRVGMPSTEYYMIKV